MNTVEILKAARELISDEKRWTQDLLGKDLDGYPVGLDRIEDAVCFCSVGAIIKVAGFTSAHYEARRVLNEHLAVGETIAGFNDTHSHAEVLALFDSVIAEAESEAA